MIKIEREIVFYALFRQDVEHLNTEQQCSQLTMSRRIKHKLLSFDTARKDKANAIEHTQTAELKRCVASVELPLCDFAFTFSTVLARKAKPNVDNCVENKYFERNRKKKNPSATTCQCLIILSFRHCTNVKICLSNGFQINRR